MIGGVDVGFGGLHLQTEHAIWDIVQGSCDEKEIEDIVKKDASMMDLVQDGWTPLHYACANRALTRKGLDWLTSLRPNMNAIDEVRNITYNQYGKLTM